MREIVLDTETTGLSPGQGHRVVEIGCVELLNHVPTGQRRQWYINPERSMPADAEAVHGLSEEFLSTKPVFAEVAEDVLGFLGDAKLVIHNAAFDMGFLNAELERFGAAPIPGDRAIDTLALARRRFPGAQATLDALCKRFGIDNSGRTVHGALLDAELLAECYLELLGGRQAGLSLEIAGVPSKGGGAQAERPARPPRPHGPSAEELAAHTEMIKGLKDPIWADTA